MTLLPTAVTGTLRYEARIVMRRRGLWLTLVPLSLLMLLLVLVSQKVSGLPDPVARIGAAALVLSVFGTPGVAVALIDRLVVARRSGIADLLEATPASGTARMLGMLVGPLAVVLAIPALLLTVLGVWWSVSAGSPAPLLAAVAGLLAVILPGALALTALAALLGLVLPSVVARIVVVVVWFWATVLTPSLTPVPTVTGTLLSPVGGYPAAGWLHADPVWAHRFADGPLSPAVTGPAILTNIALVLLLTAAFLTPARLLIARRP
jgi:ABC-2 type transport system permease protein